MEEALKNGKELSHSAHADGINEYHILLTLFENFCGYLQ